MARPGPTSLGVISVEISNLFRIQFGNGIKNLLHEINPNGDGFNPHALRECCEKRGAGGKGENRIPSAVGKWKSFDSARHMHHHGEEVQCMLLYAQMPQRAERASGEAAARLSCR